MLAQDPILAFRCPIELREEVRAIAHRQNRSLSGELRELMKIAVEADRVRQNNDGDPAEDAAPSGRIAVSTAAGRADAED